MHTVTTTAGRHEMTQATQNINTKQGNIINIISLFLYQNLGTTFPVPARMCQIETMNMLYNNKAKPHNPQSINFSLSLLIGIN